MIIGDIMVHGLGLGLPGYDADEYLLCPGRTVDGVNKKLSQLHSFVLSPTIHSNNDSTQHLHSP